MVVIFIDHYTVLGLPTGEKGLNLSSKDIKKAYKLKALELHPDKKPHNPNAVADFQKLQASFDKERREQFVESVVEDCCESDVDSFVKRKVAEMRKRKRADEFEEMQRKRAEQREQDRMSSEYEKGYREASPNYAREQWEKKIRREANNVYRDIQSIREIYTKRSAYTLFYDILRLCMLVILSCFTFFP
nr:DnaJ homolog subfamily C member 17 [Tanacetum cinerariifolium]